MSASRSLNDLADRCGSRICEHYVSVKLTGSFKIESRTDDIEKHGSANAG